MIQEIQLQNSCVQKR